jgi:putative alpha-1,2-mannosidase
MHKLLSSNLTLAATLFAATLWPLSTSAQTPRDYTRNVDPFLGVDWGGNTFVGAALPFGMVKLGPDMETFDGIASRVSATPAMAKFSASRISISVARRASTATSSSCPVTGPLDLTDIRSPRTDEVAQIGYYAAHLTRYNVKAELTSSRRVGFHRYTFPASEAAPHARHRARTRSWSGLRVAALPRSEVHLTSNHEAQLA